MKFVVNHGLHFTSIYEIAVWIGKGRVCRERYGRDDGAENQQPSFQSDHPFFVSLIWQFYRAHLTKILHDGWIGRYFFAMIFTDLPQESKRADLKDRS
jgi:hypothetical protein